MGTISLPATECSPQSTPYEGIESTVDGSAAVVWVESHISQAACAYPITPSTPMGDGFAAEFSNGNRNLIRQKKSWVDSGSGSLASE